MLDNILNMQIIFMPIQKLTIYVTYKNQGIMNYIDILSIMHHFFCLKYIDPGASILGTNGKFIFNSSTIF